MYNCILKLMEKIIYGQSISYLLDTNQKSSEKKLMSGSKTANNILQYYCYSTCINATD